MRQFKEAKARFKEMLATYGVVYPITYNAWITLPDSVRSIALYVNFYDQVQLACMKVFATGSYVMHEDALTETMKALMKNTSILEKYPSRYTPQYIYKVVYNAVYSLLRIKRDRDFMTTTVSYNADGCENTLDLTDILATDEDDMLRKWYSDKMWDEISKMDADTLKYVDYLLNGGYYSKKLAKKEDTIRKSLQVSLSKYREVFLPRRTLFTDICFDDDIESVTVQLQNGDKAVYFGEMITSTSGNTTFILMGADKDYYIPIQQADGLKILEIDRI